MEINRPERKFVTENLIIDDWNKIEGYFKDLLDRPIDTKEAFQKWLEDQSELEAILEEDMAWRYIQMTIDTREKELADKYTFFVTQIQPKLAPFEDELNKKLMSSPFIDEYSKSEDFKILFRSVKNAIDLFKEENISLLSELAEESQEYGSLAAAQTIKQDGQEITMQKASLFLKDQNEDLRKEVFNKIAERRRVDFNSFDNLMDNLIKKRHQVALNAGFDNYRDYKLQSMGRFDYSVQDCLDFHASVKSEIVPIVKEFQKKRLSKLNKEAFKPWDLDVDPEGKAPLKPFKNGEQLLQGTINMFNRIDPYFGECIETMRTMKHLDLESKEGKSPGGYNYPLYEIGVPFIFMNSVGAHRDLVTMVHEGGHAIHSFLSRELPITGFKNLPSEVAELASMSMELLSMNEWSEFYDSNNLVRAKKEQLETVIRLLPWIAQVDEFQHWLYVNPSHTRSERTAKWMSLNKEYGTGLTDWSGFEDVLESSWQRQLHIFEVPFYYIEYGIAQLGSLGVWKNSIENKEKAIVQYKNALSLAYTKTIPEIYAAAGVKFDFSKENIRNLADFVNDEIKKL